MRSAAFLTALIWTISTAAVAQIYQGYQQGQAQQLELRRQQLCNDALENYSNGGSPPPAMCNIPATVPTPPAYNPPPRPVGQTVRTCAPFGSGGTRCTNQTPGEATTYTTCYPFGNGQTRCTTQ
jgi:type II secretory pathway pseudopilin PulG